MKKNFSQELKKFASLAQSARDKYFCTNKWAEVFGHWALCGKLVRFVQQSNSIFLPEQNKSTVIDTQGFQIKDSSLAKDIQALCFSTMGKSFIPSRQHLI